MRNRPGVLAVGNFDSNIGYAWRLMERLWCELAKYFSDKDYAMHVCFPTISTIPDCLKENGFCVETMDFSKNSISDLINQCIYLKKNSIKVLYLTDFKTVSLRYAFYRLVGVKTIIVHDHTPGRRTKPKPLKSLVKSLLNCIPLISSSGSFAVSPYIENRLIEVNRVPKRKVYCVTNGIDCIPENAHPNFQGKDVTIVTVSRANYYKGIDFALHVVKDLIDNHGIKGIRYNMLGDGPDLEDFKNLSKELGLEHVVDFSGAVTDVTERLHNCDIAFHPSKGEAMSLAILEYMRAGLPVVASDNPSVSSALKHNEYAVIYKEGSVSEAAKALRFLIEKPHVRMELGREARHQMNSQFSTDAMLERFTKALDAVLDQH